MFIDLILCVSGLILLLWLVIEIRIPRCDQCGQPLHIEFKRWIELPSIIADPLPNTRIQMAYCTNPSCKMFMIDVNRK